MGKMSIGKRENLICKLLFLISPIIGYLQIPARNSIISLLFITIYLIYWYKSKIFRKLSISFPLIIWLLLTLFHCFNALSKHVPEVNILDLLHGLKIYSCICIFYFWGIIDFKNTIKILVSCFTVYLLISFIVCDFSDEESGGRMTGVIYATALGQSAAISCFYIAYYSSFKERSLQKTLMFLCLPLIVILLTQSRNALAMMGICLLAIIYNKFRAQISPLKIIVLLLTIVTLSFILYYIIQNSSFGNRIVEKSVAFESSYQFENYSTGTILDIIVGDRLIYYVMGFSLFLSSPITGIGMWNYKHVVDGTYPLHSEYMVHLCEGGIIAFILWGTFIFYILYGILKYIPNNKYKVLALFSLFQILFCAIYARLFFSEFFYPLIGITLALISTYKQTLEQKNND